MRARMERKGENMNQYQPQVYFVPNEKKGKPLLIIAAIFCYLAAIFCLVKAIYSISVMVQAGPSLAAGISENMLALFLFGFAILFTAGSFAVRETL
jgi:hypothetical protein